MYYDLTKGKISRCLVLFALPMIAGNLMQQFYNIADTLIVGRVIRVKHRAGSILSAYIGETGIWMSIPIGWGLADVTGIWYMKKAACQKKNG